MEKELVIQSFTDENEVSQALDVINGLKTSQNHRLKTSHAYH
jgi:hypothetical protein